MVTNVTAATLPKEGDQLTDTIVILHTNDSHGRVTRDDYNGQAGFTTVSATKKAYEATGATVLLFDLGDTLHGLPVATINKGADVVTIMNEIGYDAMTPGNHDFNYGTSRLTNLARLMNFPVLSANILNAGTETTYLPGTKVIVKDGVRFGLFGLTTPETAYKTNPLNVKEVTFGNPITYAEAAVKELKEQQVDYIIALAHIGVDASSEFTSDKIAAEVPGIDLIIDGHSHTAMIDGKPVDKNIKLVDHGNTLIASTGEYINNIGVITIDKNRNMKSDLIAYNKELPVDANIDALVKAIVDKQDTVLSEVVGNTSVRLEGEREFARKQETNLGNLAADAFRTATGADVAFTNGGGIRASIPAGDITKKDLVTVFPFGNYVVTKKVTGATILEIMEHGVKSYPELSGGFPQVSGITFQIDESKPAGERVINVEIGGKALDAKAEYLLATNDFLAAGGDDYTMLGSYKIVNEFGSMEEILIEYIKANPNKVAQVEGRITVVENTEENPSTPVEENTKPEETTKPEDSKNTTSEPKEETETTIKENETSSKGTITYVVKDGDTLWAIALKHSGNGNDWKSIYKLNQKKISNPNRIKIGLVIKIPV